MDNYLMDAIATRKAAREIASREKQRIQQACLSLEACSLKLMTCHLQFKICSLLDNYLMDNG